MDMKVTIFISRQLNIKIKKSDRKHTHTINDFSVIVRGNVLWKVRLKEKEENKSISNKGVINRFTYIFQVQ